MTREETKKIIMTITVSYPNWHPTDLTATVNVWSTMLEEFEYQKVCVALKAYILSDTSGFAPSIGQIVGMMQDIAEGDDIGELKAWELISKAIGNSGYHADEEFEKLPPVLQKTVGAPANLREWAMMDSDVVHSVVQSHVIRSYRAAEKRMRDEAKLPPKFLAIMQKMKIQPERVTAKAPNAMVEEKPKEVSAGIPADAEEKMNEFRRRLGYGGK